MKAHDLRRSGWGTAAALTLCLCAGRAEAQQRQLELGLEGFGYESTESPLNRDNVLGLDPYPGLGRLAGGWKETHGGLRLVARGYVERSWGQPSADTRWLLRQGYAQYWWGEKLGLRLGKQRIAWGSGLAWNPTNRVEPPKNPLNTTLEQEGTWTARVDWAPTASASLVALATTTESVAADLPVRTEQTRRTSGALRGRVLVRDTDLALVVSAGRNQRTLVGMDVARDLAAVATLHAEAAVYRGAEMAPPRDQSRFLRLVAGALRTSGEDAFALEYFYNGEGYSDAARAVWGRELDASWAAAHDPALPVELQQRALAAYGALAVRPYDWGMGLRRHYLHASWTRGGATSVWTGALRAVVGLSDGAWALTPGIGYAPRGNVTLNLDAVLLLGPPGSEYRLAPVRGALQARVRVLF